MSIGETTAKLPEGANKHAGALRGRMQGYPLITAQNPAAEVEKNDRKRGRG
jgi:hypothetical protein